MVGDFVRGASYVLRGLHLLRTPEVRRFVLVPLVISLAISLASMLGTGFLIGRALDAWTPASWTWLRYLLWPILVCILFAVVVLATGLLANVIAAPFNSDLAAKIAALLARGDATASIDPATAIGAWGSVASEAQRLLAAVGWLLPISLLALLPGGGLIASLCGWLLGAWTLGLQYLDYPLALRGMAFSRQRELARGRRGLILGFGVGVTLLHMLPLANILAMPAAIAAATLLAHDCLRTSSQ